MDQSVSSYRFNSCVEWDLFTLCSNQSRGKITKLKKQLDKKSGVYQTMTVVYVVYQQLEICNSPALSLKHDLILDL